MGVARQGGLDGRAALCETLGSDAYLYARTDGGAQFVVRADGDTKTDKGSRISLGLPDTRIHLFDKTGRAMAGAGQNR